MNERIKKKKNLTRVIRCVVSFVLIVYFSSYVYALSLEECIALGLKQNIKLQNKAMDQRISKNTTQELQSQNFGKIHAVASYNHYNLPRTLVPLTPAGIFANPKGVATTEDLSVMGIGYTLPLFTGFNQSSSIDVAHLQQKLSQLALQLSKEQLVYTIKSMYVQGLSLRSQAKAQISYIKALRRLHKDISLGVELGKRAKVDELKALADLERALSVQNQIESSLLLLKSSLATVLCISSVPTLQDFDIRVEELHVDVGATLSEKIRGLQRYRSANLEVLKNEKLVTKSAASLYPQIYFDVFYGQNFGPNDSSNVAAGDWNNAEVWQAGVTLQWDIFDFGKRSSQRKRARIIKQQSVNNRLQLELDLKRDITEAIIRIKTAVADYKSAQVEYAMTKEAELIEQVRFDKDVADLNDLLQAKARNQQARSKALTTGYEYENALFYLDYLFEKGLEK